MKRIALLALGLAAGCHGRAASRDDADVDSSSLAADYFHADSADSVLTTPRLVTEPTVIVFWLAAGDTLHPEDAAAAQEDLNYYTEKISPVLAMHGIKLYPTNSDTIFVALPNRQRRTIVLTGLDYPFGYVLVEPGDVERILAGVVEEDELLDEIRTYFEIEEDSTKVAPKITT